MPRSGVGPSLTAGSGSRPVPPSVVHEASRGSALALASPPQPPRAVLHCQFPFPRLRRRDWAPGSEKDRYSDGLPVLRPLCLSYADGLKLKRSLRLNRLICHDQHGGGAAAEQGITLREGKPSRTAGGKAAEGSSFALLRSPAIKLPNLTQSDLGNDKHFSAGLDPGSGHFRMN